MIVHCRQNRTGADQTADSLADLGCKPVTMAADLSVPSEAECLVAKAWAELGVVHTWINNAGADVVTGDAAGFAFEEKLRRLLDVDVVGAIRLSRAVAEKMQGQSSSQAASITFIGWDQATVGMEGDAGQLFGPAKAAVMAFANSLAQSLAPKIRVNTVAPGWIQTAWGQSASDYWDTRAKSQSLMGRWGRPEDVAAAVAFAADPANTFLTGQVIEINGGWNRRYDRGP